MQINLLYNHLRPHLQLGEINHLSIQITPKTEGKIILGVANIKGTFLARSIPSLPLPFLQKHFTNIKYTEFELSSELQHKIDPIIWATDQDIVPNYIEGKGKQPTTFPLSISLPTTIAPSIGSPEMVAMIRWKVVLEIFIKGTQDPLRATFPLHLCPPSEMAMMKRDPRSLFLKEGIIQNKHNNNNNINEEDEEFYKFSKFEIALKDEIIYLLKLKHKRKPSNEDVIELNICNTRNNCSTSCTAIIQQEQIIDSQTVYRNITDRLTLPFTSPSMEHRGVMMSLKNSKTTITTEYLQQKTFLVILFKSSSINSNNESYKTEQKEEEEEKEFEFKEEISIF